MGKGAYRTYYKGHNEHKGSYTTHIRSTDTSVVPHWHKELLSHQELRAGLKRVKPLYSFSGIHFLIVTVA